jgi:hypothetical protein
VRRLIYGIVVAFPFTFTAVALAYPPATITDVKPGSVTLGGLDCGTQYQIQLAERNASNTAWESSTTQTVTTAACPAGPPVADFSVSPDPAVRNKATTFTSTGTCPAGPCTYRWLHGDASSTDQIGTGPTASFTYTGSPGQRTVTLEVTDSQNREAVLTRSFQLVETSSTPAPTPSATPTPTATPSSTPTPSPIPIPTAGFPTASTTGVLSGTALTTYTGPSVIKQNGTVIDGKTLGCIEVQATNVVIRNSQITCRGGWGVSCDDSGHTYCAGGYLLVEDTEITCADTNASGIVGAHMIIHRVNVHNCENGASFDRNVTMEDSYIHNLYTGGGAHTDGVQLACPVSDVTIRHNAIYSGDTSDVINPNVTSCPPGVTNELIEENLFSMSGGAYNVYCPQNGTGTNFIIRNNHFMGNANAYSTECADQTQSGNVDHITLQPIFLR